MKNILTISIKEFKSYIMSPFFYIVSGIFLLLSGFLFGTSTSTYMETSISGFLKNGGLLLLLLIAILTMRSIAEEKKLGTIELLLTAPIKDSEIILGKFLGSLGIITVILFFTCYYPVLLLLFGDPDAGPIITGYTGLLLLSSASIAIGIFSSSVTSNQIVSAIVTGAISFGLWFLGTAAAYFPKSIKNILTYFSFSGYFLDFVKGIIDTRAIIYFLTITVLFLFLSIRSIENSRWN